MICAGFKMGGAARQDLSKPFIVVLSIAPAFCNAVADEWIASNASLLNLRLGAIANLRPILVLQQLVYLPCCETSKSIHLTPIYF